MTDREKLGAVTGLPRAWMNRAEDLAVKGRSYTATGDHDMAGIMMMRAAEIQILALELHRILAK